MKNFKQLAIALVLMVFFVSCDKDENDSKVTVEKTSISSKWNVSNSDEYESFEFNDSGNYIVVKKNATRTVNNQNVLFGTYEYSNNSTIVLSDFGTIVINEINDNSFNFSLQLTGSTANVIEINSTIQEVIANSSRTEMLCRTWELVSVSDSSIIETENGMTVLFSEAGTYFVTTLYVDSNNDPSDNSGGGLAHWMWKDEAETQILYSWNETPEWDEDRFVEITELTTSTLIITEDDIVYSMQPVSNNRSVPYGSFSQSFDKINNKDFLGK